MILCLIGPTQTNNSMASTLFQESHSKRIVGIERLAELSSVYLDSNSGLLFSELNWSNEGDFIFFETTGQDNLHHMWKITLDGTNSSKIEKIDFPFEKFSEIYGYKISPEGEVLFAAVREYNGSDITPEPLNLYKIKLGEDAFAKLTNFDDPGSNTAISNFDWLPEGKIVYETVTPVYPEDPSEPIEAIKTLWTAGTIERNGNQQTPTMLWNGSESIVTRWMDASPDGQYLAFGGENRLRVFDDDGRDFVDIISKEQLNAKGIYPGNPKWSSNSQFIAYWQTEYHEVPSSPLFPKDNITTWLRVVSKEGSIDEAVFQNPGPVLGSELPAAGISPDGRFIAVAIPYVPYNYANDDVEHGGVYLIELGPHVIPEYPPAVMLGIGALAVASMIFPLRYWHSRLQRINPA